MSRLRRFFNPGQICFLTSVTAHRKPILVEYSDILLGAIRRARLKIVFSTIAWVIMPEHFHLLVDCPSGRFPRLMQMIKLSFTLQYQRRVGHSGPVWQHRYWDHIIRSAEDMDRHFQYIHFNPVKHRMVCRANQWRWSSYQYYLRQGYYPSNWKYERTLFGEGDFGE